MNPNPSQSFPLTIIQGATFIQIITYYDSDGNLVDLSGYSADMQFRSTVEDTGSPIIDASTGNGLIVINGTAGSITVAIPAATTAGLSDAQQMVYNLFITSPGGIVTALLAGNAVVQGSTIR